MQAKKAANLSDNICPRDEICPPGAPCALEGDETIIRLAKSFSDLTFCGGIARLAPMSWSTSDLQGKFDKAGVQRCASVLRDMTLPEEKIARLQHFTKEQAWKSDPVCGTAKVGQVRKELFCAFSDPVDDNLGRCPTHAGIVKSRPLPVDPKAQLDWLLYRTMLADLFQVGHFSGAPVKPPELSQPA